MIILLMQDTLLRIVAPLSLTYTEIQFKVFVTIPALHDSLAIPPPTHIASLLAATIPTLKRAFVGLPRNRLAFVSVYEDESGHRSIRPIADLSQRHHDFPWRSFQGY